MTITALDIQNIATLARLRIDEDDIADVTARIAGVLDLVGQMSAIDTTGVEPMANPMDGRQRLREDIVTEVNSRSEFQAIAPDVQDGLYLVPRVIE
ncbi:MAG: aspartyl-tRNA(Asn)/glutamyl-tRNA(Gln) amidotransferase subunit C [Halieaceae bacterium]|jgi:aspartyl-tRNA(Asn)/glutamyl-tRNA(Gln) amidotransferase subunit C